LTVLDRLPATSWLAHPQGRELHVCLDHRSASNLLAADPRISSARGLSPLRFLPIRSNPLAIAHHRSNFYFRIRFKSHSRALPKLAASAANAGAFLQTALSEVIRRQTNHRS
jgi:hypothetical protein